MRGAGWHAAARTPSLHCLPPVIKRRSLVYYPDALGSLEEAPLKQPLELSLYELVPAASPADDAIEVRAPAPLREERGAAAST